MQAEKEGRASFPFSTFAVQMPSCHGNRWEPYTLNTLQGKGVVKFLVYFPMCHFAETDTRQKKEENTDSGKTGSFSMAGVTCSK